MRIVVRVRRARSSLSRYLGLSVGAHGAALAVVLILPMLRPKAELIPIDAAFVELSGAVTVPASGSVAAAPPAAAPAKPPPAREPEAAHAVEKIPEPSKKKDVKPKDIKKKEEPPPPAANEPGPAGPPGSAQTGREGPTGVAAGAAGITSLEAGDPGLSWYNAAVAGALESAWMKPVLEGVGDVQSVVVAFEIGRDGNVFNLAIDVPSGIASLDRSALRAVQDAAPFPPPPPEARGSSVRQRIRFDLRPDAR